MEGGGESTCHFRPTTSNFIITFFFSLIFCLSVIGNFCVIFVLIRKAMRSITNIYLLNLAIADLCLSVVCMPATLLNIVTECWQLGDLLCRLFPYLQPVVVTASAYTLAVISFERYYAICRPLHSRVWQTRSHAYAMISLVWTIAVLGNLSLLAMYEQRMYSPNAMWCAPKHHPVIHFIYQIYMTIVLLLIPQVVMITLYGSIIKSLRQGMKLEMLALNVVNGGPNEAKQSLTSQSNGVSSRKISLVEQVRRSFSKQITSIDKTPLRDIESDRPPGSNCVLSTQTERSLAAKQRVIRMLIVICLIFFLCWSPLYIWWLLLTAADVLKVPMWNSTLNTVFLVLCYTASCTNPITYCFLNKKFRLTLLASFGCKRDGLRQQRQENNAATVNTDFE